LSRDLSRLLEPFSNQARDSIMDDSDEELDEDEEEEEEVSGLILADD